MANNVFYALIKFKAKEDNDAIFEVIAITNAQGFVTDSPTSIFPNREFCVSKFYSKSEYADFVDYIEKVKVVETKLKIVDEKKFLKYKECEINIDGYGIKKVKYLYNAPWVSTDNNLFYTPENRILNVLKKYDEVIPIDLKSKKMYSAIHLVDSVIHTVDEGLSELKVYDFVEEDRLIAIPSKKYEYYMTEKSFRKVAKVEVDSIDFLNREQLKSWLRNLFLNSKKDYSQIESLLQSLDDNIACDENVFNARVLRCKQLFKETVLSSEDIKFFLEQTKWKDEFESEKQRIINATRELIEKDSLKEKEKILSAIQLELEQYKNEKINDKILEQELQLEQLKAIVKEKEQNISNLEELISSKSNELGEITAKIQDEILALVNYNRKKSEILFEIESQKLNLLANFNKSTVCSNENDREEDNNSDEDYYPRETSATDLEDDEAVYRIVSFQLNTDLKQEIVSPLGSVASIIPDVSYAHTLAHFAGNCHVKIITVEHGWYHFEDFRKAGLVEFWNKALSNPTENYLLVLQNINMIPICSALQPIVDVVNGYRVSIPGSSKKNIYPDNLRILATVLPSSGDCAIGIPLDRRSYKNFNFVGSPNDTLPFTLLSVLNVKPKRFVNFNSVEINMGCNDTGFERYADY